MKKIILALFVLAFFASEADAFRWFGYNSRTINGTGRRVEIFKTPVFKRPILKGQLFKGRCLRCRS